MRKFIIGRSRLDLEGFVSICRGQSQVDLSAEARTAVDRCLEFRRVLEHGEKPVYGVNTGFGKLSDTRIPDDHLSQLQENLIRSHAVGWGDPLDREQVRGMIFLRAASLSHGFSGVRAEVIEQMLWLLSSDIHPFIPSRGSVGASGDLAPLAHLALVLMGEGHVLDENGKRLPAGPALAAAGRKPLKLEAREGLALINGTQMMNALGLLSVARLERIIKWGVLAAALTVEALEGSIRPFGAAFHALRPHPGSRDVAAALDALLADSPIIEMHHDCPRVQDPYSVRCVPQVLGACLDSVRNAEQVFLREAGSVTDNPVLFPLSGDVVSGGHFHGEPLALHLDALALAGSEVASVAERRIYLMMGGNDGRLPRFLAANPGLESGLMIGQYLAAALVSECKNATAPASADTIPTSMGQEDHVSMGSVAALKLGPMLDRVETVVALELLTAGRALQFLTKPRWARMASRIGDLTPGKHTARVLRRLGAAANLSPGDRPLTDDIEAVVAMVREEEILEHLAKPLASLAGRKGDDGGNGAED